CPPRKLVVEIFRELGQRRTRLRIESTRSHQSFNFVDEAESASHGPLESGNSIGGGDGTSDGDDRSVLAGAAIICKAIRLWLIGHCSLSVFAPRAARPAGRARNP